MSSPDRPVIDTPEQTLLEFPLAGLGSRFLAMAADTLCQFVGTILLFIAGGLLLHALPEFGSITPLSALAIFLLVLFVINYGYFAFFEAIWNGQTPGKRYFGLRVTKDDGRPITVDDALTRNLLRIVDQIPGVYAVGAISILFSKQRKRLGDYVAGTVVAFERTTEAESLRPTAK